ncbi:permease, partial [Streptosporangium sp. NPDC002607]
MSELRTGQRSVWTDDDSPLPPDSWGRAGSARSALPWGFTLVIVLLVVGRFTLAPYLTAPALQTWAT